MQSNVKNKMLLNLRRYVQREKVGHQNKLFDHQILSLDRTESFLTKPKGAEYSIAFTEDEDGKELTGRKKGDFFEIVSATGSGKTRMFGCLMEACDVPTLILTPRKVINDGTKKEFCDEIGIDPKDVGVYDSARPRAERAAALEKKYLITTYQSLPSLMRNGSQFDDKDHAHYRPLVILDEVHKGQGHEQSKAVKKFLHKCIVAGFTATDAGAKDTLFEGQEPIYKLGIVPAIQQDLLCSGVRAGVIDVKIDEEWLKNFKQPGKGRDFKEEDILKFTTNPSVIKGALDFHFTRDPEQLRRINMGGHLDRLPTVFFTKGVKSAQMCAQMFNARAKAVGSPARADYVSGEMPTEKRNKILKQFASGELKGLANDSVLEMGWSEKSATVEYLLKPAALTHLVEQPLGRLTRRPDNDYAKKFGQEKVALAINVRAPQMNPILFAQILGGAPEVYSKLHPPAAARAGGGYPTGSSPWPDGIDVHIEHQDMIEVVGKANKLRAGLPEKTDEWQHAWEIANSYGGQSKKTEQAIAALTKAFEAEKDDKQGDGIVLIKYNNWDIHLQKMQVKGTPSICFLKQDLISAGLIQDTEFPPKTDDWWANQSDIRRKPGGGKVTTQSVIADITKAFEAGEGKKQSDGSMLIKYKGNEFHVQKRRPIKGGGQPPICFLAQDLINAGLVLEIEFPPKTDDWWSVHDISKKPGGYSNKIEQATAKLIEAFKSGEGKKQSDGSVLIEYDGNEFHVQKRGAQHAICFLGQDFISAGLLQETRLPPKTDDWWTATVDIVKKPGGQRAKTKDALTELTKAFNAGEGKKQLDGSMLIEYEGNEFHMQKMETPPKWSICFLGEDLIKAGLITAAHREDLKRKPIPKKSMSPDSEDLGRTGRRRT